MRLDLFAPLTHIANRRSVRSGRSSFSSLGFGGNTGRPHMRTAQFSGEAEDRDRGVAAANFGSDQVVYPHEARDDRYVLHAASTVSDHTTAGRATQATSQQHPAGSGVQRQQIATQLTGED